MAEKLQFSLVSPERKLMEKDVDQVDIPASEGMWGVLAGHAPSMATLAPGVLTIFDGGNTTGIFVAGGFAEITPAGLTVLAEEALPVSELDAATIDLRIKTCEDLLSEADRSPDALHRARQEISSLQELRTTA